MTAPASFFLRGIARGTDLIVQLVLLEAAYRVSKFLPSEGLFVLSEDVLVTVDLAVGLAVLVGYPAVAEWLGGATLGKHLTGLQVRTLDGEAPGFRGALVRNIALPVDGFLFGLVAYSAIARSSVGQRIGDQWGGTQVVRAPSYFTLRPLRGWPAGVCVGLVLLVGSYLVAR